ncbi:cbb3-type cytochrome c oxidase subunit 3 [Wohlfahrtiimonas chitiniclastica]|uniref:Cbb3-type cytochrome oxidase component FixQ n=2 Tax=Wohlfahrtiimonas chitiniclastica TaxID=400946 RepID=L8XZ40_9GAMM|nr:cbb3-type cytochrome c oxidase subunit 3 [Wohlfahrtiimonas chitiniclastica]ELV07990.1 Hypothetical protein F387_00719 [Wohlfahrtiimonas chitiniclastica SH04]KZS23830.1 hypothetical protein BMY_1700 [Wohlfahrtiimonas chitiniclastica]KZX36601.1 hypothetical protein A6V30_09435 [Wohlfahrtiimonas chitiniclastica]MBS7814482.1 cbb3-type cytochrome c oxidase subunit 3 [Wohlfahrtiimonas chitiniclastica]MBS7816502.1 cbb3-type cytochrome c oxidase subunit 3 [Wohlfahrtiimonas chitiniclastica]
MIEFFSWFTDMSNSKTVAAVIFFTVFVGIIIYVFTNKDRKARYDGYRMIPLLDDEDLGQVNSARAEEKRAQTDASHSGQNHVSNDHKA